MDTSKPSYKIKDLRIFFSIWAGIFAVFFLSGIYLHHTHRVLALLGLVVSMGFILMPRYGIWIYRAQVAIGSALGWCISRLTLVLLFTIIFIPIGLLFRIIGRDVLERHPNVNKPSYFKPREKQPTSMKYQF